MNTLTKISIFSSVLVIALGVFAFSPVVNIASAYMTDNSGTGCTGCGGGSTGGGDVVIIYDDVDNTPNPPKCDISTNLSYVVDGQKYTLTWKVTSTGTTNAYINGYHVEKTGTATYTFDAQYNKDVFKLTAENAGGTCSDEVVVYKKVPGCTDPDASNYNSQANEADGSCVYTPTPSCDVFSASPTSLPYGGGDTVLTWETTDAGLVKIDNGVGTVAADGSKSVHVTNNTTYTLTASNVDGSNAKTCVANVTVGTPQTNGLTCSDVSFTASDTSVNPGDSVVLNWVSTGNVTGASIDHGIGSVSLTGNRTVTVNDDITYHITISDAETSVSCPVSISTTSGGGDNSPYCALYASDRNIDPGQRVSLRWNTSHVNKVTLVDDNGNVLLESNDRSDMDSNLSVNPTEDTNYTLIAKRGSDEIECDVRVKVADNIYVSSTRSQTPRVAGISLTQVPYTGFEAGPALTLIFYALLAAWALYVAYVFVIKRDTLGRVSLAGAHGNKTSFSDVSVENDTVANEVEAYVASAATATVPNNLPVAPVVDYTNAVAETVDETEAEFANLENIAHSHKVLLSTDALRYLVNTFGNNENAEEALKAAIDKANATFPIENGWLVLNLSRLESLLA